MSGETDKVAGKIKQAVGDVAEDEELETEGKTQEAVGKIKDGIDTVADKVKDTLDD